MRYIVTAKKRADFGGFFRSGRYWPDSGTEVDESEITDAMRNEPMLIITPVVEVPIAEEIAEESEEQPAEAEAVESETDEDESQEPAEEPKKRGK